MLNIRVKVKKSVKKSEKELKDRIFSVYDQCATNVEPLSKARKQFLPRLKDVVAKERRPTKIVFD